jgi:hypothetical protein
METPKEYYYTYYSYEEWGRGYFGSRGCKCLPEDDIRYFGSFRDKTFKPTQKIILKDDYATREEAYVDEIILHDFYDVGNNPHFANRAKATSAKFCLSKEQSKEIGLKSKELGIGLFSLTKEQRIENGRKGGPIGGKIVGTENKRLGRGIFGLSPQQKSEIAKKANKLSSKNTKKGRKPKPPLLEPEELKNCKIKNGKKSGTKHKENKTGVCGISPEEHSKRASITNSQKWRCLETGHISNAGGLSKYQKSKGIDTSLRERLE